MRSYEAGMSACGLAPFRVMSGNRARVPELKANRGLETGRQGVTWSCDCVGTP